MQVGDPVTFDFAGREVEGVVDDIVVPPRFNNHNRADVTVLTDRGPYHCLASECSQR